jgi:hypothetical protein
MSNNNRFINNCLINNNCKGDIHENFCMWGIGDCGGDDKIKGERDIALAQNQTKMIAIQEQNQTERAKIKANVNISLNSINADRQKYLKKIEADKNKALVKYNADMKKELLKTTANRDIALEEEITKRYNAKIDAINKAAQIKEENLTQRKESAEKTLRAIENEKTKRHLADKEKERYDTWGDVEKMKAESARKEMEIQNKVKNDISNKSISRVNKQIIINRINETIVERCIEESMKAESDFKAKQSTIVRDLSVNDGNINLDLLNDQSIKTISVSTLDAEAMETLIKDNISDELVSSLTGAVSSDNKISLIKQVSDHPDVLASKSIGSILSNVTPFDEKYPEYELNTYKQNTSVDNEFKQEFDTAINDYLNETMNNIVKNSETIKNTQECINKFNLQQELIIEKLNTKKGDINIKGNQIQSAYAAFNCIKNSGMVDEIMDRVLNIFDIEEYGDLPIIQSSPNFKYDSEFDNPTSQINTKNIIMFGMGYVELGILFIFIFIFLSIIVWYIF